MVQASNSREWLVTSLNSPASIATVHISWLVDWYSNMHSPWVSKTIDIISLQTACTGLYRTTKASQVGEFSSQFKITLFFLPPKCLVSLAAPSNYGSQPRPLARTILFPCPIITRKITSTCNRELHLISL